MLILYIIHYLTPVVNLLIPTNISLHWLDLVLSNPILHFWEYVDLVDCSFFNSY